MNWGNAGNTILSIICSLVGGIAEQGANNILRNSKDEEEKNSALKIKANAKDLKKVKNKNDFKNLENTWR